MKPDLLTACFCWELIKLLLSMDSITFKCPINAFTLQYQKQFFLFFLNSFLPKPFYQTLKMGIWYNINQLGINYSEVTH